MPALRRPPPHSLDSRRAPDARPEATPPPQLDATFFLAFCDARDAAYARAWLDASKPARLVRHPPDCTGDGVLAGVLAGVLWLPVLTQLHTDARPLAPNAAACRVARVPLQELRSRAIGSDVGIAIVRPSPAGRPPLLVRDAGSPRCAHWLLRVAALVPLNDYGGACRRALDRMYCEDGGGLPRLE